MIEQINILFDKFSKFDSKTIEEANKLKLKLISHFNSIGSENLKNYKGLQRKKFICYETIGYIPYNINLLTIDYLEYMYFNGCENYWNDFLMYEEFIFYVGRNPKDRNELIKFDNLDEKMKLKILLKKSCNKDYLFNVIENMT